MYKIFTKVISLKYQMIDLLKDKYKDLIGKTIFIKLLKNYNILRFN